ncbi:MAG TPA: DPP IV N-terminal domain-containing protein, partial [Pyrinomonadaceae bacterium]
NHQKDPAWSADGKYVAYSSAQRGLWEIYRADADGSNQMGLSDGLAVGAVDDWPSWSPDGEKIVFVRNRQLWTVSRDGGTAVKLSTGSDQDEQPAWSPDGTKIAFVRDYSSATAQIWVMDADGSNQRNLTNTDWPFSRFPAWSPDGSKIAFQRWNDIWVMDADGSNQTQITFAASGGYSKPEWSPDGTRLVVTNGLNFEGEIFVMNADGSNITKIADGVHPTWQALPPLGLITVHGPDPVLPGAELTYTLTVTNNHTLKAGGATLTDTLDPGTTFVSAAASKGSCATPAAGATGTVTCSFGDLYKGEQATVTVVVQVAAADGTTLHNAVTGAATYAGYGQQTQSAEVTTQVLNPSADVALAAWINEGYYTSAGGQVVYGLNVFNAGPAAAEGATLTGHLPAGVTVNYINNDGGSCAADGSNFTCTFPSLGRYENLLIYVTATSNASGAPYTPLTATFGITSTTPDGNAYNNTGTADFFIAAPPLPAPTPGPAGEGLLAYSKQLLSTGLQDVFRQRADGAGIVNLSDDDPISDAFFFWSPDGSRIAFLRYDFEHQVTSLVTVAADGTGRTLLTSVPGEYIDSCAWSPDGTRLAFSARPFVSDVQANDVFVINADGTGRSKLTNGDGLNGYTSWSPDGTRLSYTRLVYDAAGLVSSDIRVVGADGSGPIQIPQAAGELDSSPRWSPDGSRLAFTRALPGGSTGLYTALSDGTDLRPLTNDAAINDTFLSWSPDGSKLSYGYRREDGTSTLEVVRADGTGRTTVYEAPAGGSSYDIGSDKWSPDGTRLAFDACGPGCNDSSIYVVGADGVGRVELGSGAEYNYNPDWSPDGRRVAFQTYRNGNSRINIINADGTGRVELPGEPGYHGAPVWQPRKAGATPAGSNVTVAENGVTVTFSNVTAAGVTTITPIDPNSLQGIPGEYVINAGTLAFEIHTTAVYAGPITLGFQVAGIDDPVTFGALRVLHGEPPPVPNFVDRTVLAPDSPEPDFATRTVYARVTSLSPFVVTRRASVYGVRALYDETKTYKSGGTVPVKLQLTNAAGANVSSPSLAVKAVGTTRVSTNAAGVPEDAGNSNPDFDFRYDAGLGGYVYNLKTKGYAPGTYVLTFRVAGDPTAHTVQFRIAK